VRLTILNTNDAVVLVYVKTFEIVQTGSLQLCVLDAVPKDPKVPTKHETFFVVDSYSFLANFRSCCCSLISTIVLT
jgi:hypothetical protein